MHTALRRPGRSAIWRFTTMKPHSSFRVMRPRPAPADNGRIRRFPFLAGLAPLGQNTRGTARVPAACRTPFTASHGMTHGVHGGAAVVRLSAHPAFAARLAKADIHVVGIAKSPNCGP